MTSEIMGMMLGAGQKSAILRRRASVDVNYISADAWLMTMQLPGLMSSLAI